jgi:serine/threonine-protein kinase
MSAGAPTKWSHLPPARVVASRYRIASVIGEGAQSVVYLAHRQPDDEPVALKVIHRHLCGDPQIFKRFHREAAILGSLEGEHIVKLLDFIEEDGLLIIALEHVEGSSLEALLEKGSPLDLDLAIEVTLQVCAALGAAHANDVIHRDLKPANVLVEQGAGGQGGDGQGPAGARGIRVKVVDFGLGKVLHGEAVSTSLTEQGMIFGTPEYMAPEQAGGDEVDARADLYAAGVMLYEMVVGEVPFQSNTALATMTAHLREAPRTPRSVRPGAAITPALEAVILRALAKSPDDRFASARELAHALASARDQPLVITPGEIADPDSIATSDTDLHLERAAMGQARTLRAEEMAELAAEDARRGAGPAIIVRAPSQIPSTKPSPGASRAPGALELPVAAVTRPRKGPPVVIEEEPTAVSGAPIRSRGGYMWALVAIVAAAVGVAIGIIVGTR